jgi:hypothetical protein
MEVMFHHLSACLPIFQKFYIEMSLNIKVVLLTNVAMYEKLIDTVYHIVKKKIIYGSIPECVSKAGSLKSRTLAYSWNCFHR